MWRFKPFMPKEQTGLEGRSIDVGNLKIQVRNAIAEGGFSCVYLARDIMHPSKQYALKHMICNDGESLELVMKEISVMKLVKGHPNVVTLCAHTVLDMGRTKEALLVMEYCEKSLANVLESRGSGYFEEKQVLSIFRDVCNAVFAMHCQSPPIAHRDLKAENILLGSDGLWKLCDFGSTSTNHKRFEKPEDMGIEEDIIRKHTTPAYRAPEMWDLFRRELINEKVDIWALGCLLYRICYLKLAFDGESKLQILNGNYCIPDLPKYSSSVTGLIRDMLQASPDDRPDITQVWSELLRAGILKSLPDRPPEMCQPATDLPEGISRAANKDSPRPRRSPPPPPSSREPAQNLSPPPLTPGPGGDEAPLGAFWSTQHAKDSIVAEDRSGVKFDEELPGRSASKSDFNHPENIPFPLNTSLPREENSQTYPVRRNVYGVSSNRSEDGPSKDFELNIFQEGSKRGIERPKVSKSENVSTFENEAFKTFVAEFNCNKLSSGITNSKSGNEQALEAEVKSLKEQLQQINLEKTEITSKYEKLSAICRSQRNEIQELKQALMARTPSPNRDASKNLTSSVREKTEATVWDLQQGMFEKNSQNEDSKPWQAFTEDPKLQTPIKNVMKSVRTRNGPQNKQATETSSGADLWGFGTDSFTAAPTASAQKIRPTGGGPGSQLGDQSKTTGANPPSQPAGWAGF